MSPGNRNNRHRETPRHGRMQIIPDGDTKRLPCGVRAIDPPPSDYRETYKPLISRAIFLIFFLFFVSASFFLSFFLSFVSHFSFSITRRERDDKRSSPLPPFVHASLDALMSREWFFCPIVKCNNQIRILGWAGDERGTPGRLSFPLVLSRRNMICTCKLFDLLSLILLDVFRLISSFN